ncbi:aspartate/glutamate racemase family protein [Streptomyces sp. NPDC046925]|uniref:aspartate/glutamate racemase family protein n=1 Tax=Streptomyces sp. NPDC046925 TaxID=3155375 RepID=UPI0034017AE2
MIETQPLIALIHAVPSGARIAQDAFAREFPEARIWNLLDDRLLDDARTANGLDGALRRRMLRLIANAVESGARGVLLTCSSYGEVVDTARTLWTVPILKSDESMFRTALSGPHDRIAVAASTPPAVPAAAAQLDALMAETRGTRPVHITTALSEQAAAADGPQETARHLADALAATGARDIQSVLLAQYSLAFAGRALADLLHLPVLDGAAAAARDLRARLLGDRSTAAVPA